MQQKYLVDQISDKRNLMDNQFSKGISELRDKLIDSSRKNKLINYKRLYL